MNDGYKCTKVDAGELLKQAVRKMTRPGEKKKQGKTKVQAGTLLRKVKALDKLVKEAEKAGKKHVEYGTAICHIRSEGGGGQLTIGYIVFNRFSPGVELNFIDISF